MRDANDRVLYVGKAKNLRQRLNHYRLANPDRMPRRHLRLVRLVARIDFQLCADESAALQCEARLLRELKPRFNRAGVWPGKTQFLAWRWIENSLEMEVMEHVSLAWQCFGPLSGAAHYLMGTLARLLWLALHPAHSLHTLPAGWIQGRWRGRLAVPCPTGPGELPDLLARHLSDTNEGLTHWLISRLAGRTHPFERLFIETELETLKEFQLSAKRKQRQQLELTHVTAKPLAELATTPCLPMDFFPVEARCPSGSR